MSEKKEIVEPGSIMICLQEYAIIILKNVSHCLLATKSACEVL